MNIINYINKYGKYKFSEKEFNEVDNLVFSAIIYVNLTDVFKDTNKIKLSDAYDKFIKSYKPRDKEMIAIKGGIEVFENAKNSERFKDVELINYSYIGNNNTQFAAVTFKINKKLYYVAFEGTDSLVSGWKEDLKTAYIFPVDAQKYAIKYLNKYMFKPIKLIVGGHSKGGNLALVSAMEANIFIKNKIIKIYNNDGQGLIKKQISSKNYKKIRNRYIHIIPNYSIVGLLLRHENNYKVVLSNKKGILSHDLLTWQVSDDHLIKDNLSRFSRVFDEGFSKWLDRYDTNKREKFVDEIFKIFEENNINDIMEISLRKDEIKKIIKESKNIDPLVKKMTIELFKILNKTNLEYPLF